MTPKQESVLDQIRAGKRHSREIAVALGLKSHSGVHTAIVALERMGYVERTPQRHCGLRLLAGGLSDEQVLGEARRRGLVVSETERL